MKIAFWSPMHGTGATANLLAVSIALSKLKNKRTLVTQTHFTMNNLEKPLLGNVNSGDFFRDTGLDAIMRHFKSGNLGAEQVENCSIRISEKLFLLAGTRANNKESYENEIVQSMVTHIFSLVEPFYDIVLIDTNSGNNPQSLDIIKNCDLTVITMRQNKDMIDTVMESNITEASKVFYLFGNYDGGSRYSLQNLRHLYKKINRENSGGIPLNSQFMDAISEEKIMKYIGQNLYADEDYSDSLFFEMLRDSTEKILKLTERKCR